MCQGLGEKNLWFKPAGLLMSAFKRYGFECKIHNTQTQIFQIGFELVSQLCPNTLVVS